MSESKEYNGWTNYETWCVNLWLENEQGTYNDKNAIIRHAIDKYRAEKALQEYVEENMIPDLGASMAADLLGAALCEVNWREIVENAWDDLHDGEDDDKA